MTNTPSLIVRVDGELTADAAEQIKAKFIEAQKSGKVEVLPITPPATLAEALAVLQTRLPRIGKDKTASVTSQRTGKTHTYDYANLATVSEKILPLLGKLGLSFTCSPTLIPTRVAMFPGTDEIPPPPAGVLVLEYVLRHASSNDRIIGFYPLPASGSPQEIGSAITYARRYCLCAVTGVAPDEDDDDGQAASAPLPPSRTRSKPPERAPGNLPRNRDGQISRSQATDDEKASAGLMTDAQQREHNQLQRDVQGQGPQGTERLQATPADDPFYVQQLPQRLTPPHTTQVPPARAIVVHLKRLLGGDVADSVRLEYTAALAGRTDPITSTNDLTAAEGVTVLGKLGKCKDRAALDALLEAEGPSGA